MSPDGLTQWLKKIENGSPIEINMGLDRVKKIQERMALNFDCPIIVVGGTNGKGSVCAILESIFLDPKLSDSVLFLFFIICY